jgi:hypothetical protein
VSLGHSAGWRQMVSYASFYLRQGPHQRSVAQVEAELAARYEREPPEEIASAVAGAGVSRSRSGVGGGARPARATAAAKPDSGRAILSVSCFWCAGYDSVTEEEEWREFEVNAAGAWTNQQLFETLEESSNERLGTTDGSQRRHRRLSKLCRRSDTANNGAIVKNRYLHVVYPHKDTRQPGRCMSLAVSSQVSRFPGNVDWSACWWTCKHGRPAPHRQQVSETRGAFWELVQKLLRSEGNVWCFVSGASRAMNALGMWDRIEEGTLATRGHSRKAERVAAKTGLPLVSDFMILHDPPFYVQLGRPWTAGTVARR